MPDTSEFLEETQISEISDCVSPDFYIVFQVARGGIQTHYLQLKLLSGKNARAWDSMDFT